MHRKLFLMGAIVLSMSAQAKVVTRTVEYTHNGVALEGILSYDDTRTGKRPGVLIIHDWGGVGDYVRMRAEMLARLGYVAFAADIYGKGVRPANPQESAREAGKYRADRALLRARANAGLEQLKRDPNVDPRKVAAIGYCFGGGAVLELARSGADFAGAVSFHGNLDTPNPADARNIKAKVLVLHGAVDPMVPITQVEAFGKEMTDANVDWQLIAYGGAVHSFSNPKAGNDPSRGSAYNEKADKRSWEAMRAFFNEIFKAETRSNTEVSD